MNYTPVNEIKKEEFLLSPIGALALPNENSSIVNKLETNAQSNFSQLYKNVSKTFESNAQQRRETFLIEHKEKHNKLLDGNRDLSQLFEEIEDGNDDLGEELMDVENFEKSAYKKKRRLRFKMSMSEWLTDVPEDLAEKWLVKFCPEGKRRLIVANKRITKSFNKFGHLTSQFCSNLPGGGKSRDFSTQKSGLTVLDCVFNRHTKTFYILDMLVWNSTPFLDCEAELRHSWIQSKSIENSDCFEAYGKDSFTFKVLLDFKADIDSIRFEMNQYDYKCGVECDGVLFYHKEAPYTTGQTPLIIWLKPFMLPEFLHIDIPRKYEEKKPDFYTNQAAFFKRQDKQKRKRRRHKNDISQMEMEVAPN